MNLYDELTLWADCLDAVGEDGKGRRILLNAARQLKKAACLLTWAELDMNQPDVDCINWEASRLEFIKEVIGG